MAFLLSWITNTKNNKKIEGGRGWWHLDIKRYKPECADHRWTSWYGSLYHIQCRHKVW
jgi:hypothetical protein